MVMATDDYQMPISSVRGFFSPKFPKSVFTTRNHGGKKKKKKLLFSLTNLFVSIFCPGPNIVETNFWSMLFWGHTSVGR